MPYPASSSLHNRLCDRSPPVAVANVIGTPGARPVQRFVTVRYFRRMSDGKSSSSGISATGADPTQVSGSVSSQA